MDGEKLKTLIASIEDGSWEVSPGEEDKLLTDETLDMWATGKIGEGYKNAVQYLRPLHPALRRLAISEGVIWSNMGGGGRWSSAVEHGAREIAAGRCENIMRNQAVIANDPTGAKATAAAERGVSHSAYLRSVGAG